MRWMLGPMVLAMVACDGGSGGGAEATEGAQTSGTTEASDGTTSSTSGRDESSTTTGPSASTGATTTTAGTTAGDAGSTTDIPGTEGSSETGAAEDDVPVVVAVGATHARYVSLDDGITWCQVGRTEDPDGQDFDTPFLLRNVSYTGGLFIAGSWREIFVSDNGLQWETLTGGEEPAFGQWTAQIQYGNGWWVATGGYGQAMRSADLETWEVTSEGLAGTEASRTLAFGNGVFVTGRDGVGWWESEDGASWTQRNPDGDSRVIFDGSDFAAHPGYDESPEGTRLRTTWPNGIERAVGDGPYEAVGTADDSITRFAFGFTSQASIDAAVVDPDVATCLGL